jgi:hypothetical protein
MRKDRTTHTRLLTLSCSTRRSVHWPISGGSESSLLPEMSSRCSDLRLPISAPTDVSTLLARSSSLSLKSVTSRGTEVRTFCESSSFSRASQRPSCGGMFSEEKALLRRSSVRSLLSLPMVAGMVLKPLPYRSSSSRLVSSPIWLGSSTNCGFSRRSSSVRLLSVNRSGGTADTLPTLRMRSDSSTRKLPKGGSSRRPALSRMLSSLRFTKSMSSAGSSVSLLLPTSRCTRPTSRPRSGGSLVSSLLLTSRCVRPRIRPISGGSACSLQPLNTSAVRFTILPRSGEKVLIMFCDTSSSRSD